MMTKPIYISFDEWGAFGNSLLPTLAMAQYFNTFINHANVVKMANYTLLTSILDRDKEGHLFKSPSFYTFKLFSNNCRGIALNPLVQCDTFSTSAYYNDIPYLDVSCVYKPGTKTLVINVVNRHENKAVSTEIVSNSGDFAGKASVTLIDSKDIHAPYTYADRNDYVPVPKEFSVEGHEFTYSFPAHSFTQITVRVK
jgi:alpha-N-arabinofuranosidase